jgi:hypothetical protein
VPEAHNRHEVAASRSSDHGDRDLLCGGTCADEGRSSSANQEPEEAAMATLRLKLEDTAGTSWWQEYSPRWRRSRQRVPAVRGLRRRPSSIPSGEVTDWAAIPAVLNRGGGGGGVTVWYEQLRSDTGPRSSRAAPRVRVPLGRRGARRVQGPARAHPAGTRPATRWRPPRHRAPGRCRAGARRRSRTAPCCAGGGR